MNTSEDNHKQLHHSMQPSPKATSLNNGDKNDDTTIVQDVCNALITAVADFEKHLPNFDFEEHLQINVNSNINSFEENQNFKNGNNRNGMDNTDSIHKYQNLKDLDGNISSTVNENQLQQLNKQIEKTDVVSHQVPRLRRPKASVSNFSCAKCNIQFQSASAYASHNELHSMTRPFPCDICQRRYPLKYIMERHKRNVHSNVKTTPRFSCEFCKNKFLSMYEMDKHKSLCKFNSATQQDDTVADIDICQGTYYYQTKILDFLNILCSDKVKIDHFMAYIDFYMFYLMQINQSLILVESITDLGYQFFSC